jgi:secondary thiamine-phosphate synthase enzyme
MKQAVHHLEVATRGEGLVEITEQVRRWLTEQAVETGLLTVWCCHTSASLLVQENADPDVRADLVAFFRRIVPEGSAYQHQEEGPDDMPAHIKAARIFNISKILRSARQSAFSAFCVYEKILRKLACLFSA